MKLVCACPTCKYSSEHEDSSNIIFVSFPKDETATVWAHNSGRPDLLLKSTEELHLNHYICSHHLESHYFIRDKNQLTLTQGAIPTLFSPLLPSAETLGSLKTPYVTSDVITTFQNYVTTSEYETTMEDYRHPTATIYDENVANISADNQEAQEISVNCLTPYEFEIKPAAHKDHEINQQKIEKAGIPLNIDIQEFAETSYLDLCRICVKNPLQAINIFEIVEKPGTITILQKIQMHLPISPQNGESMPHKICGDCQSSIEGFHEFVIMSLMNDIRLRKVLNVESDWSYEDKYRELIHKNVEAVEERQDRFLEKNNPECCDLEKDNERATDLNCLVLQPLSIEELGTPEEEEPQVSKNSKEILQKLKSLEMKRRCGHCSQSFSNRKELQTHISEAHSGQGPLFKCGTCEKSYQKWSSLDVHEATHRQDKPYLCDLCGKSFKHANNLRGHKRVHLDVSRKKRYICETCGSAFRSGFHLREHMNQHDGNKPYACEQCGKAFSKRIQLRQHKLSHGSNKYVCPICGLSFNRRGNMNSHIKRHERNDGTYKCSVCESKCKSMSDLKFHRKQHSESEIVESIKRKSLDKKIWKCDICGRFLSKMTHLTNHQRMHERHQEIECETCGKKLASKSSLKYHVKSMHTCEKSHLCPFCGDGFVTKEARLIHERIHSGERPYSCKLCNMQYRCSSNLSQHMRIHSELRQFICKYCSKGFTRKGALTVHARTHTGEKPFSCSICQRKFSQKHDMKKHEKTHINEAKILNCEKCEATFITKSEITKHLEEHSSATQNSSDFKLTEEFLYSLHVDLEANKYQKTSIEFL